MAVYAVSAGQQSFVFDALTSRRVYKEAWEADHAFTVIQENAGSHFDPTLVAVFMELKKPLLDLGLQLSD